MIKSSATRNDPEQHESKESDKTPKRHRRSVSYNSNVEVLVVADESMLNHYHDQNVETYVLTIMNIVSIKYSIFQYSIFHGLLVWSLMCMYMHCRNILTGGNWQKWKRVFLTCPCHEIYRDEAVGLKSCKNTWKITIFVKMWNLGQYRENLIFCQ